MLATQRFGDIVSSLATSTIIGCAIALDDLALFVGPFSNSKGGSAPRKLVLEFHVLSAKLLDLLADKPSCLERLDLTYRWIGDSKTGSTSVGLASRRSYAAFPGYHLGKVLGYEREDIQEERDTHT